MCSWSFSHSGYPDVEEVELWDVCLVHSGRELYDQIFLAKSLFHYFDALATRRNKQPILSWEHVYYYRPDREWSSRSRHGLSMQVRILLLSAISNPSSLLLSMTPFIYYIRINSGKSDLNCLQVNRKSMRQFTRSVRICIERKLNRRYIQFKKCFEKCYSLRPRGQLIITSPGNAIFV